MYYDFYGVEHFLKLLYLYSRPENLKHVYEYLGKGDVELGAKWDLSETEKTIDDTNRQTSSRFRFHNGGYIDNVVRQAIVDVLKKADGNQKEAAKILGVSEVAIWRYMKRYDIDMKKVIE